MSRLEAALTTLALLLAVPAAAQITGQTYEASGQAGYIFYDGRSRVEDGPGFGATLGWRFTPSLVLEAQGLFGSSKADTVPHPDHSFASYGFDLRWNLRSAESRAVPYVLTGLGVASSNLTGGNPENLWRGSGSLGLGMLVNVANPRTYVRLQVRDAFFRERDALEFSNHFVVTAGVHFLFGGRIKDVDRDGVPDWKDHCPGTPIGATVDASGCPHDADQDSVLDGLDQCPNTPKGCKVDSKGCPNDADGDGVCDGVDQCPDTPKGAPVDAAGCSHDTDGDGVFDGIDQCPDTPKGCTVDAKGCPTDSDGDGVCDGVDKCPNTPAGLKVDANGCPIEVSEKETQLLDTGVIRIQNINFKTGKANIEGESFAVLDDVGRILQQYPALKIEIGGHTDDRGRPAANQKLSQARADSVMAYLTTHFPMIPSSQLTAKGYGSSSPVVPNVSDLARAKNRRVEFKVLNKDVLRTERERRRFIRKDETPQPPRPAPTDGAQPAPRDTTSSAPTPGAAPAAPDTSASVPKPGAAPAVPDTTHHE